MTLLLCGVHAQGTDDDAFRQEQLSSERVSRAVKQYEDTLRRKFHDKNLKWPPADIYLRAFKLPNEMEVWARDKYTEPYRHVYTYRICAISGKLGPKRKQGDRQVPEGFYFIDDFNPRSEFHLSLLLNYPNYCDLTQGEKNPGGDIYIHGGCLTIGCLPMEDEGIREIYALCLSSRLNGEESIPVHIYPTRMSKAGMAYLFRESGGDASHYRFWNTLRHGYEYFETHHKLLPVMYSDDGTYVN